MKKIIFVSLMLLSLIGCSGARYTVTGIVSVHHDDGSFFISSFDNITVSREFGSYSFITQKAPPMISGGNYTLILRPNGGYYDVISVVEN